MCYKIDISGGDYIDEQHVILGEMIGNEKPNGDWLRTLQNEKSRSSAVVDIQKRVIEVPLSEFPYCANSIDICVPRGQLNDIYSASQPAFWYVLSVPASSAEKLMKIEREK